MKLIQSHVAESGHWYTDNGVPAYEVTGKDGTVRPTTLRDARVHNLYPSVTTVCRVVANPGIQRYREQQILMASLTLPRKEGESESDWIDRIWRDADVARNKAADFGTRAHASLERHYQSEFVANEFRPLVDGVAKAVKDHFGEVSWDAETSFASDEGYGGKVDLYSPSSRIVVDFKGKDGDLSDAKCYDEHFMQLAAYAHPLVGLPCVTANVFFSRDMPGVARVIEHKPEEQMRGHRMFRAAIMLWQEKNKYRPMTKEAA